MRTLSLAGAALIAASPLPLLAQDAPIAPTSEAETSIGDIAETLDDPLVQEQLTRTLQSLSVVLLDMPLAPLAEAAAEMTGEDPELVDPDMTLRQMSPEAEAIPEEIGENLPGMMTAMGGMARGLEAMLPALRDMAARMEDAIESVPQYRTEGAR